MTNCSFCGKKIKPGYGKKIVQKSGRIFNFCRMKCEKNLLKLKRTPRKTKWTDSYHKEKGKK